MKRRGKGVKRGVEGGGGAPYLLILLLFTLFLKETYRMVALSVISLPFSIWIDEFGCWIRPVWRPLVTGKWRLDYDWLVWCRRWVVGGEGEDIAPIAILSQSSRLASIVHCIRVGLDWIQLA